MKLFLSFLLYLELSRTTTCKERTKRKGRTAPHQGSKSAIIYEKYDNGDLASCNIKAFIEDVSNAKRLHSSIGYRAPNELESEVLNICSLRVSKKGFTPKSTCSFEKSEFPRKASNDRKVIKQVALCLWGSVGCCPVQQEVT